jgi:hypothetical protein
MEPLEVEIEDIVPFVGTRRVGAIQAGVNVLTGRNGSGKTTIIRLATVATGNSRIKPGDIPIVAGAARGRFRFSGRTLIVERDRIKRVGDAVEVGGLPIEIKDLDDPGLKGAQPQAEARLRALCQACRIDPNGDNLWRLIPARGEEWPNGLELEAVIRDLERRPTDSLPAAAKRIKMAIQEQRREREIDLQRATEHAKVLADRAEQARKRLEAEAGEELAEAVEAQLAGLRWSASRARGAFIELKAKQQAEAQALAERRVREQELIAAAGIDEELAEAETLHRHCHAGAISSKAAAERQEDEVRQVEDALNRAKAALARAKAGAEAAQRSADDAFKRFERLSERKAELDKTRERLASTAAQAVDGLSVDIAEAEAEKGDRLVTYRTELDRIAGQDAEAETARQAQAEIANAVEAIAAIDGAVWSRLGDILAERIGEDRLRVVDGVVEAKHPQSGEWHDLESTAWSEGQRWHLVLGLMVDGMRPGDVAGIDGDCPIDDVALGALGARAAEKGVALLLEKESPDDLRLVLHMGGRQ